MRTSRDLASQPLALAASDRTDARWYGVHSQPHGEETALRHLQRQGFTAFLPRRLRTIRHARRVTTGTEAYFPRYLFIALDLRRDRWRMVNGTVGVDQLLSACDRPLPFRRGVVEALMAATGPDGVLRPSAVFKPGQKVRVSYGAFAEEIGMLEAVTSSGAIRVLLNMMDRQVSVQLSRDAIGVIP